MIRKAIAVWLAQDEQATVTYGFRRAQPDPLLVSNPRGKREGYQP